MCSLWLEGGQTNWGCFQSCVRIAVHCVGPQQHIGKNNFCKHVRNQQLQREMFRNMLRRQLGRSCIVLQAFWKSETYILNLFGGKYFFFQGKQIYLACQVKYHARFFLFFSFLFSFFASWGKSVAWRVWLYSLDVEVIHLTQCVVPCDFCTQAHFDGETKKDAICCAAQSAVIVSFLLNQLWACGTGWQILDQPSK